MTEYERKVLDACDARLKAMLADPHYPNYEAILRAMRGRRSPAFRLIRAVIAWKKDMDRCSEGK